MLSDKKRYLVLFIILIMGFLCFVHAQDTSFDRKKQWFIDEVMADRGPRNWGQRIWVWLDKIQKGEIDGDTHYATDVDDVYKPVNDIIHNIIRAWGTPWYEEGYPPYGAWRYAESTPSCALIWVLYKYSDCISQEDHAFLEQLYHYFIHSSAFATGTANSQLQEMVGRYIHAQYHPSADVQYSTNPPPSTNIWEFTWEGRSYVPGGTYNVFQLPRDWIMERMNYWLLYGEAELESPNYT